MDFGRKETATVQGGSYIRILERFELGRISGVLFQLENTSNYLSLRDFFVHV